MPCGKKPCCVEDGEKPVAPPCVEVGELRFVISGFISGGDGMLEVIELTDGMGLSIVDSIESVQKTMKLNVTESCLLQGPEGFVFVSKPTTLLAKTFVSRSKTRNSKRMARPASPETWNCPTRNSAHTWNATSTQFQRHITRNKKVGKEIQEHLLHRVWQLAALAVPRNSGGMSFAFLVLWDLTQSVDCPCRLGKTKQLSRESRLPIRSPLEN